MVNSDAEQCLDAPAAGVLFVQCGKLNQYGGEGVVDIHEAAVIVRAEANAGRLQTQHP
jgi:hypothetical protein